MTVKEGADPKKASNWIMGEVLRILNETQCTVVEFKVKPSMLTKLLLLIDNGSISGSIAKTIFDEMAATGKDPQAIVEEKGLTQISDKGELENVVRQVLDSNPNEVEKYKSGKTNLIGFFVGQVMKMTKGKANPKEVNAILREMLS